MVARVIRILVLVLFPSVLFGQSIHVSVSSSTENNNTSTFLLGGEEVTINANGIRFLASGVTVGGYEAFGLSQDYSVLSFLKRRSSSSEIVVMDVSGDTLNAYQPAISLGRDDPSLDIYSFDNGDILLRDKITNFTFYDTFGKVSTSMSSSSETKGGEAISEVKVSADGKTIVVYNPKIKRGNSIGSKAQVKLADGSFEEIFFSNDRFLKGITISDEGNILVAITAKAGTEDEVIVMDAYGEVLNRMAVDEQLVGASLSADNDYLCLYSQGRVMVRSAVGEESVGATSFRASVFLADYFPEDNMILALTGSYSESSGILNNVEFRAIDLKQREITSKEFSGALGFSKAINPRFKRSSSNEYMLLGANKRVSISVDF